MRNAQQYLIDFANDSKKPKENWFKALIYSAIDTNGDISPEKHEEIINSIITGTEITLTEPNIGDSEENQKIQFKQLKHFSGVNALASEQTINFSNDITILYGMNGAGKSGYFKILNEVVGGNQKKDIIPNIYSENTSGIKVELKYLADDDSEKTKEWNGQKRAIPELNRCKVFDSSYLNGLLETRKSDQTLIQPSGLNLFTYLVGLLDKTKEDLISRANEIKSNKPAINLKSISDEEITSIFNNHKITESGKEKITRLFVFSEENDLSLKKIEQGIKNINQINIQDKIKILRNNQREIEDVKNKLEVKSSDLLELIKNVKSSIKLYNEKETLNKEAKSRFEVLNSIPENDSQEWKAFINAGDKYTKVIGNKIDLCPYCRQPLKDESSISIVKSYSEYLKDSSEIGLSKANVAIGSLLEKIKIFPEISLSRNALDQMKDIKISGVVISDQIFAIIENSKKIIEELKASISSKEIKTNTEIINANPIINELEKKISSIETEVDCFSREELDKEEELKKLENQLMKLKENKSISDQKEEINKWIEETLKENSIRERGSSISTADLSKLSQKAHSDLLTKSLKSKFNDELCKLGCSDLTVSLEDAGARKGTSSTKLVIKKDNDKDIKSILSEGEQKAVALALFISEIILQKGNYPVILDDPVNSLDHNIASRFADRLMELNTQIILFNHHKLFLDRFETSKDNHICKTIDKVCNKKGKHIKIYKVQSEGKSKKGVLINYKGDCAKNHIESARNLLKMSPFEEKIEVANLIRSSVESIIDEVIFNDQIPRKYSNRNNGIKWSKLKKLNKDDAVVDTLEKIHGRVSGGVMHIGTERNENPIEVDEFDKMVSELEEIMRKQAK